MRTRTDRNYDTLFERIANYGLKLRVPFLGDIPLLPRTWFEAASEKLYPNSFKVPTYYSKKMKEEIPLGFHLAQVLGGLQPLLDISKELETTVTRYKSVVGLRSHLFRDILLIVRSIGNVLAGLLTLAAVVPVTMVNTIYTFSSAIEDIGKSIYKLNPGLLGEAIVNFGKSLLRLPTMLIADTLSGIGKIGLGVIQAAKAIALPVIAPIRLIHTLARGVPKINTDQGLQDVCDDIVKLNSENGAQLSNGETADWDADLSMLCCIQRLGKKLDNAKVQHRRIPLVKARNAGIDGDNNLVEGVEIIDEFNNADQKQSFETFFTQRCNDNNHDIDGDIENVARAITTSAA